MINVGQHLLLGQTGLLAEPGKQVGGVGWQSAALAVGRTRVPSEQPALGPVPERALERTCSRAALRERAAGKNARVRAIVLGAAH